MVHGKSLKLVYFYFNLAVVFTFWNASVSHAEVLPPNPCKEGFEIKVRMKAANTFDTEKVENKFILSRDPHSTSSLNKVFNNKKSLGSSQCMKWQKKTFPHFKRMLFENQHLSREKVVCHHVAFIDYKFGIDKGFKSQRICVGDSSKDRVSYGFRLFYEGSK